jgi:hypothetical protein
MNVFQHSPSNTVISYIDGYIWVKHDTFMSLY